MNKITTILFIIVLSCTSLFATIKQPYGVFVDAPYFNNKHWANTIDTTLQFVNETFGKIVPRSHSITTSGVDGAILIKDNSTITISSFQIYTPVSKIEKVRFIVKETKTLTGVSATAALAVTGYNKQENTVLVIEGLETSAKVHRVDLSNGTIADTKDIPMSAFPSGGKISFIDTRNVNTVIIGGTMGLLRMYSVTGNTVGTEDKYDIGTSEDVTAATKSYAGTNSGKIYKKSGNAFLIDNGDGVSQVNDIRDSIAACNNGEVLVYRNSKWEKKKLSFNDNIIRVNPIYRKSGYSVETLTDTYEHKIEALWDSETEYTVTPQRIAAYIDSVKPYPLMENSDTMIITLNDKEGNKKLPLIKYNSHIIELKSGGVLLRDHDPEKIPENGYADFTGNEIKVVFTRFKKLYLFSQYRQSDIHPTTGKGSWLTKKYEQEEPLHSSSASILEFTLGSKLLKIDLNDAVTLVSQQVKEKLPNIVSSHNRISINAIPSSVKGLSLYSALGKRIFHKDVSEQRSVKISRISQGVYFLKLQYDNKTVKMIKISPAGIK